MSEHDPHDSPFPTPELDTALSRAPPAPRRRRPATLVAAVAATALLGVAAVIGVSLRVGSDSGNGEGAPAISEGWEDEATDICSQAASEADAIAGDPSPRARRRLVELGVQTSQSLRRESPPREIADEVEVVVSTWERSFRRLEAALERARPGAYEIALARVAPELERVDGVARAVGLELCADVLVLPLLAR